MVRTAARDIMAATSHPERRDGEALVRVPEVMAGTGYRRHLCGAGGLPTVIQARHTADQQTAVGS
ncbi:hypothetical protein IN07_20030 [Modestobacter caceresii]|uniref:Uncharacterized protein n=1 Tax=Modestobacter caceresii TaxID=1522368 RepID=A0A098Y244_9ACTN|nr:hypothetical protein IN07_20030 [Modestobacter caceresii]